MHTVEVVIAHHPIERWVGPGGDIHLHGAELMPLAEAVPTNYSGTTNPVSLIAMKPLFGAILPAQSRAVGSSE